MAGFEQAQGWVGPRGGFGAERGRPIAVSGQRAQAASRPLAGSRRRAPWWVLGAGVLGLAGIWAWVAAQPLPPSQPTPALQAVEAQVQQQAQTLAGLQSQATSWATQRSAASAQLQQEQNVVAALTGTAPVTAGTGGGSSPAVSTPAFTMTRGS